MQSYPLQLNPDNSATSIGLEADLFVYESGAVANKTNLLLQSADFSAASWTKTRMTVTADAVAAPDATLTADKLVEDATTGQHIAAQVVAGIADGQHTVSLYMKAAGRTLVQVKLTDSAYTTNTIFDISAGTVTSADPNAPATITAVAGAAGWYRVTVTRLVLAGSLTVNTLLVSTGSTTSYLGDAVSGIYVWGAQLERGLLVSAYIPTTTAQASAASGSAAIKVKPENGAEILLKPGQRFRITEKARRWFVSAADGSSSINANVIIGSGEFDDANTLNTIKLDASFANNVNVNNTVAAPVNVRVDPAQVLNVAGNTVQYTNAFADAGTAAVTAQAVFSAASNVNGAWIEFIELAITPNSSTNAYMAVSLVAKAGAPATMVDGDCVFMAATGNQAATGPQPPVNIVQPNRIKIAAGKGLWLNQSSTGGTAVTCMKSVLYTLL